MRKFFVYLLMFAFLSLSAGCQQSDTECSSAKETVFIDVNSLALDSEVPIQFPLDELAVGVFNLNNYSGTFKGKYHAAEDYFKPSGTPVYAIADGIVSFSGPMAGYGWLIVIDHPQANVYSLYGHLSPSWWRKESGNVIKGELIAYLGDTNENGSSAKYGQMEPHLHFAIRVGQMADYPGFGDKRWEAGWTVSCPESIGWLQPSKFIADYAEGNVNLRGNPYTEKTFVTIYYILIRIWIVGVLCNVLLGVLMGKKFQEISTEANTQAVKMKIWKNITQYKSATLQKYGRPGALYNLFRICILLTSLSSLFMIVIMIIVK